MFGCSPSVLLSEAKERWDFWIASTPTYEAYTKEVLFFRIFKIAWIFCWEYKYQNILPNSFPLSVVHLSKSDGGMNPRQSSVAKKMLNISVGQKPKNSPSKTSVLLTKRMKLHVVHLPLPKWMSLLPLQNPNPRVLHKNNEISSKFSKMIPP